MITEDDLDGPMTEFFRRSVASNPATGVPKPFEIETEYSQQPRRTVVQEQPTPPPVMVQPAVSAPPTPAITSVSPTSGPTAGGTLVTIDGTNFIAASTVKFDTTQVATTFVDSTRLRANAPAHAATSVDVKVTNVANSPFIDTYENSYTYVDGLVLSPNYGATVRPTTIQVTGGTNFTVATTVSFGGTPATGIIVTSPSTLQCDAPAHATGVVTVTIHNSIGPDLTASFQYQPAPTDNPYGITINFPNPRDASLFPSMIQGNIIVPMQAWSGGSPYSSFHDIIGQCQIVGSTNIASSFVSSFITMTNGQASFNIGAVLLPASNQGEIQVTFPGYVYHGLFHYGLPAVGRTADGGNIILVTVYR